MIVHPANKIRHAAYLPLFLLAGSGSTACSGADADADDELTFAQGRAALVASSAAEGESAVPGGTSAKPPITCPGRAPTPRVCAKTVCLTADLSWDEVPLAAGTPCQGAGECDGHMHCILPQPAQKSLVMPSRLVDGVINLELSGTVFSIDGTGNSPPVITGYRTECVEGPGPIGEICTEEAVVHHSYVRFSDQLKKKYRESNHEELTDYTFDDAGPFCRLGICAHINQIGGDFGSVHVTFTQGAGGAYADLVVPLQSAEPTLIIDLPAPDLQLSNMQLRLHANIVRGGDGVSLRVEGVSGQFEFDSDLTNFPDWLISPFYDIDQAIRDKVHAKVAQLFSDSRRQDAIALALTRAAKSWATTIDEQWTGFKEILSVHTVADNLVIDYVPN